MENSAAIALTVALGDLLHNATNKPNGNPSGTHANASAIVTPAPASSAPPQPPAPNDNNANDSNMEDAPALNHPQGHGPTGAVDACRRRSNPRWPGSAWRATLH